MKITPELMTRIQTYTSIEKIKPTQPIFTGDFSQDFIKYKHRLAKRLNEPINIINKTL